MIICDGCFSNSVDAGICITEICGHKLHLCNPCQASVIKSINSGLLARRPSSVAEVCKSLTPDQRDKIDVYLTCREKLESPHAPGGVRETLHKMLG